MSVSRLLTCLGFALWVSVSAAAPEFIWQGLLVLAGHFSRQNVYAIFLIGLILTVFVEPIMERARDGRIFERARDGRIFERARDGRWLSDHRNPRSLLLTAPIAFSFGVVAVALHECMTAYLGHVEPGAPQEGPQEGVVRGFQLILEWAWVPLAVTLAWFSARLQLPARILAAILASVWVVGVGWFYGWPPRDIVMTSIPCVALIPLGQAYVARNWGGNTFRNLAVFLAGFSALWLGGTRLLQAALPLVGLPELALYGAGDMGSDFRFYLGWAMGLALAPNPVPVTERG